MLAWARARNRAQAQEVERFAAEQRLEARSQVCPEPGFVRLARYPIVVAAAVLLALEALQSPLVALHWSER